jgi:nucleotide-binding universal stress UspA family protein
MIELKTILVPVDFSDASKKALTYGLTLAGQFDAKLILAHIVPESSALMYAFPTDTTGIEKEQEERAKREIQDLVPAEYRGTYHVQTIVRTGTIENELLAIVREEGADLVVMGTHGRRNFGRWVLGSVTERMLREVPVPLLTVSHVDISKHVVGLVSLTQILYATDLCESSPAGTKYAVELARRARAKLTIVHAVYYADAALWARGGIPGFENERRTLAEEMQKKVTDLLSSEELKEMQIEILVVEGKPFERVLEIAEDRRMDLIVLNLQSKSRLERAFLGSTAERIVRLSSLPVLSIPAEQDL